MELCLASTFFSVAARIARAASRPLRASSSVRWLTASVPDQLRSALEVGLFGIELRASLLDRGLASSDASCIAISATYFARCVWFGDVDLCDDLIGFDQITFAHEHLDQATGGLDRRIHLDGLDPPLADTSPAGGPDMPPATTMGLVRLRPQQ